MKVFVTTFYSCLFLLALTLTAVAQEPQMMSKKSDKAKAEKADKTEKADKAEKAPKAKKAKAPKPTTDPEIQKCIEERFANAPSMQENKPTVAVSGGVATITGAAKSAGAKGGASRMATACGATEVKNEMTVPESSKPPKKEKKEKKDGQ